MCALTDALNYTQSTSNIKYSLQWFKKFSKQQKHNSFSFLNDVVWWFVVKLLINIIMLSILIIWMTHSTMYIVLISYLHK